MEYDDSNVPIHCGECDQLEEGVAAMADHVLESHTDYTPEQVEYYVRQWADDAYEQIEAENIWRAQEYRRTGHDPMREWDDGQEGK